MKIKDKKPLIIAALAALGVYVNGEFFGVFDYTKRTFVE